ncbi:MAG: pyridoxal-phosphate dependent enzyme, partial [Acidobacteria bacterium]|nr:pyridoxal-phosphate dependent enzyme [Acidobacteriota bacterium]
MSTTSPEARDVTLEDILAARERIAGLAVGTPLKPSWVLSERLGRSVSLKLENCQPTGAFKVRGAANALLNLAEETRRRGVTTFSSGNHGRALAYVAQALGVPAVICLSELVPPVKVEAIRRLGAEVVVSGPDQDVAERAAHELARDRGLTYISPFDDPAVIAGQGTLALEVLEQCPEGDTLVVQ